jgi:acetyl esterase/lipase
MALDDMTLSKRALLASLAAAAAAGPAFAQTPPTPLALPPLPPDARTVRDVVFATRPTGPLKLDLYIPARPGPRPLILWIHGGGWFAGDRGQPAANFFVADGYAVASIDYRLSGQAAFPAPLLDCKAAVRFLRAHGGEYGLDTRRILAAGPMSGGHLASLLGVTAGRKAFIERLPLPADDRVQGVLALYAVQDFIAWRGVIGGVDHDKPGGSEDKLLGAFVLDRPDLARAASPTTYVSAKAAPFMLVHGRRDERVPWSQSQLMASALKLAGAACDLVIKDDAIHADPSFWAEPSRAAMRRFFERTLGAV